MHLKGIVSEARRQVFLAGGFDVLRAQIAEQARLKRLNKKHMKALRKEIYDRHGYYNYEPLIAIVPDPVVPSDS